MPTAAPLTLENHGETGRACFLERRELGAINTGGTGTVTVDGKVFSVESEACIYVGMGAKEVKFASNDAKNPAKFFILSCPAHAAFPTAVATAKDATTIPLGTYAAANQRVIRQYIHEKGTALEHLSAQTAEAMRLFDGLNPVEREAVILSLRRKEVLKCLVTINAAMKDGVELRAAT